MFPGQVTTGGTVSATVTRKLQLAETPPLVTVQVTVVWPLGKLLPEGGTQVATSGLPAGSAAVTVQVMDEAALHSAAMLAGHWMVGRQSPAMRTGGICAMLWPARPPL